MQEFLSKISYEQAQYSTYAALRASLRVHTAGTTWSHQPCRSMACKKKQTCSLTLSGKIIIIKITVIFLARYAYRYGKN